MKIWSREKLSTEKMVLDGDLSTKPGDVPIGKKLEKVGHMNFLL